jgi:hypothetical protein
MMATFNNNNGNLLPAITCRRTKFPSPNPLNTSIVTSITAVSTTTIAASSSIVTAMATAAPVSCQPKSRERGGFKNANIGYRYRQRHK